METAEYWLMAQEYGIWNVAIASLQFWAEDLNPITLGVASECVYTHFFWTSSSHTLPQLSEEALFGHLVLALNSSFTQQLSLADEGYESGSNKDLPTPLHKTPCIHHVSSMEHASFNPACTMPCHPADAPHYNTQPSPLRPVHHCLTFLSDSSESDQDSDSPLTAHQTAQMMRRRISKWYLLMMNTGLQIWYQREHSAYTKMGYLIMYVNTHALMGLLIITLSHIWTA